MIGVVDYGMGNLFSVEKALERLGVPTFISDDPTTLQKADALILPGVGAFKDAIASLYEKQLVEFLKMYIETKPLLGICLGMQLLFDESEENGVTKGLGMLQGRVIRLQEYNEAGERLKIPHMGWNQLTFHQNTPFFKEVEEKHVYFVHSYYVQMNHEHLIASCPYGLTVPAIVGTGNVYGMQFHPEKSGQLGMSLLSQFVKLASKEVEQK